MHSSIHVGMFETGLDLSVSPDRSPNGGRANGSVARRLEFSPPIPISSRSRSDSSRLSTREFVQGLFVLDKKNRMKKIKTGFLALDSEVQAISAFSDLC